MKHNDKLLDPHFDSVQCPPIVIVTNGGYQYAS